MYLPWFNHDKYDILPFLSLARAKYGFHISRKLHEKTSAKCSWNENPSWLLNVTWKIGSNNRWQKSDVEKYGILEIKTCGLGSRIRDVEAFWYKKCNVNIAKMEQRKVRTIFETECFFNLFLEVSQIQYFGTIQIGIKKKHWDLETYRKS